MIKILDLQQSIKYLKILVKYFQNNRIPIDDQLPTNIVIRVEAILMLISETGDADLRKFKSHIQDIIQSTDSIDIKRLSKVILNKMVFAIPAQILYEFLKECVADCLDDLLKDNEVKELQEKILHCY